MRFAVIVLRDHRAVNLRRKLRQTGLQLGRADTGFRPPADTQPPPASLIEGRAPPHQAGRADGNSHVEPGTYFHAEEARRRHSNHLERDAVQCDLATDGTGRSAVMAFPESMTDHRPRRATALVVGGRKQAAGHRVDPQSPKEIAAHPDAIHHARHSRPGEVERIGTPREGAGENVLAVAHLLPQRIGQEFSVTSTNCSGFCTGSVRRIIESIRLNMAVLAPMPRASVKITTVVNTGAPASTRTA